MPEHTTTKLVGPRPTCDICNVRPAAIDGKTVHGPWAFMCDPCHSKIGVGLGLGQGQRLIEDGDDAS
jgi:hypothetical protein